MTHTFLLVLNARSRHTLQQCLGYGLEDRRFVVRFLAGIDLPVFYTVSTPTPAPYQRPIQRVLWGFPTGRAAGVCSYYSLYLVLKLRKHGAISPLPYALHVMVVN